MRFSPPLLNFYSLKKNIAIPIILLVPDFHLGTGQDYGANHPFWELIYTHFSLLYPSTFVQGPRLPSLDVDMPKAGFLAAFKHGSTLWQLHQEFPDLRRSQIPVPKKSTCSSKEKYLQLVNQNVQVMFSDKDW